MGELCAHQVEARVDDFDGELCNVLEDFAGDAGAAGADRRGVAEVERFGGIGPFLTQGKPFVPQGKQGRQAVEM
jgi:hypothetical protein